MPVGNPVPIPPQSGTFSPLIRGFHFVAPVDFSITGVDIPTDASTSDGRVVILRSTGGAWPTFPADTTSYDVLVDLSSVPVGGVSLDIPISNGDIIGVLGYRANINSYGAGGFASNIDGNPITLTRFLSQNDVSGNPVFNFPVSEENGPISRVQLFVNGVVATE